MLSSLIDFSPIESFLSDCHRTQTTSKGTILKTLPKHIATKTTGIFYKKIISKNNKIVDKVFGEYSKHIKNLKANESKNRTVMHTLRHTFASHLAINGTPILAIQSLMNHSSIEMTMRYAHLAPDAGYEQVRKLYK